MSDAERAARWRDLVALAEREIPGLKLAFKDDAPGEMPWLHRVLHRLGAAVVPAYSTRFTTVFYPVVYFPDGARDDFERTAPMRWYATLRHELVHLRDMRDHRIWMPLSYALFPPFGVTMRAFWELRAYAESMVALHEDGAPLDDAYLESLVELFAGRAYLAMLWPRRLARRVLRQVRDRVLDGDLLGVGDAASREGRRYRVALWSDFVRPMLRRTRR